MKELLREVVGAGKDMLEQPQSTPVQERLRVALTRLDGCGISEGRIFLDVKSINDRAASCDWHFMLRPSGELVVVFRRRGVLDVVDAATFRVLP